MIPMSRAFTSEEYEQKEVPIVIPPKIEEAADHDVVMRYSRGRSLEDPRLPFEIGMGFLNGSEGFFKSQEFAEKWLKRAAEMDHADAMLVLAEVYLADTRTHGYRKPAKLIRRAAELGSKKAAGILDMNQEPSTKKAYDAFRLNGELGDPEACYRLAEGFEKGYYGKDKYKAAATWYIRAFRLGKKEAARKALELHYHRKTELTEEEREMLRGGLE